MTLFHHLNSQLHSSPSGLKVPFKILKFLQPILSHTCLTLPSTNLLRHPMILIIKVLMELRRIWNFMWKRDQVKLFLYIPFQYSELRRLLCTRVFWSLNRASSCNWRLLRRRVSYQNCKQHERALYCKPKQHSFLSCHLVLR